MHAPIYVIWGGALPFAIIRRNLRRYSQLWPKEIFLAALWRVTNYVTASRLALTTIWTRCNSEKLPKEFTYPSVHVTFVKKYS